MKTIKLTKGLELNKSIISKLQQAQMKGVRGRGTTGPRCTCFRNTCGGGALEV